MQKQDDLLNKLVPQDEIIKPKKFSEIHNRLGISFDNR